MSTAALPAAEAKYGVASQFISGTSYRGVIPVAMQTGIHSTAQHVLEEDSGTASQPIPVEFRRQGQWIPACGSGRDDECFGVCLLTKGCQEARARLGAFNTDKETLS